MSTIPYCSYSKGFNQACIGNPRAEGDTHTFFFDAVVPPALAAAGPGIGRLRHDLDTEDTVGEVARVESDFKVVVGGARGLRIRCVASTADR